MNAFEPASGKHAIVEVAAAIFYNGTLNSQAVARTKARREAYAEFLPIDQPVAGFQVSVGAASPSVSQIQGGFAWQRVRPDGQMGWHLSVQQDYVSANCLEYTRWDEVWEKLGAWLYDMHQQISGSGHSAVAFSLQFIDGFTRKQPVTGPILKQLFSEESKFLPARFFLNGELWHLHQGWFDETSEIVKGQRLTVLNLGANRVGGINTVTIDHYVRVNLAPESPELFNGKLSGSRLELGMHALHDENKETLRSLLVPEVARAIRLIQ